MFDLLIVRCCATTTKQPLFTVPERVEMLREVTKKWACVEWTVRRPARGLRAQAACRVILRGIRAVSDYDMTAKWR